MKSLSDFTDREIYAIAHRTLGLDSGLMDGENPIKYVWLLKEIQNRHGVFWQIGFREAPERCQYYCRIYQSKGPETREYGSSLNRAVCEAIIMRWGNLKEILKDA